MRLANSLTPPSNSMALSNAVILSMSRLSTNVDNKSTSVVAKGQRLLTNSAMNMGKRIALRLAELKWDQVELCNRVEGLEPQALSAVIKRDSGRSKFAAGIAQAMGVDLNWLMTGEGEKETTRQASNNYPREIEIIISAALQAYHAGALSSALAEAHAHLFRALTSNKTISQTKEPVTISDDELEAIVKQIEIDQSASMAVADPIPQGELNTAEQFLKQGQIVRDLRHKKAN